MKKLITSCALVIFVLLNTAAPVLASSEAEAYEAIGEGLVWIVIAGVAGFFAFRSMKKKSNTNAGAQYQKPPQASQPFQPQVQTQAVFCPACKNRIDNGMSFCSKCGTRAR